jgi:hypothetical protein
MITGSIMADVKGTVPTLLPLEITKEEATPKLIAFRECQEAAEEHEKADDKRVVVPTVLKAMVGGTEESRTTNFNTIISSNKNLRFKNNIWNSETVRTIDGSKELCTIIHWKIEARTVCAGFNLTAGSTVRLNDNTSRSAIDIMYVESKDETGLSKLTLSSNIIFEFFGRAKATAKKELNAVVKKAFEIQLNTIINKRSKTDVDDKSLKAIDISHVESESSERGTGHHDVVCNESDDHNIYLVNSEKNFSCVNLDASEKLYAYDSLSNHLDLDIDSVMLQKGKLTPLDNLSRGHTSPDRKRLKTEDLKPIVFVNFNTGLGKAKPVILRALLDSGGSRSLVIEKYTKKFRLSTASPGAVWTTTAEALNISTKCKATFTIPELHNAVWIEWNLYATKGLGAYDLITGRDMMSDLNLYVTKDLGAYDMIIGRDMMSDLGIDIKFSNNSVTWNGVEVPMKDRDATFKESFHVGDTTAMEALKKCVLF